MSEPNSAVASAPVPAPAASPAPVTSGVKLRGAEKMARIPIKIEATTEPLRKPSWIRAKTQGTPE
ncbi:MAG: lipoyl synthase, partial [Nevskiales bacterium]